MNIAKRAKDYMKPMNGVNILALSLLSDHAVAILNTYNDKLEYDIFFDLEHYEVAHPEIWRHNSEDDSGLIPPPLRGKGMGLLQGIGTVPNVDSFAGAMNMARSQLNPKGASSQWYDVPVGTK